MKNNKWFKKLSISFLTLLATTGTVASSFAASSNNVPAHTSLANSKLANDNTGKYSKDENFYTTPDNIFVSFQLMRTLDEMGSKDGTERQVYIKRLENYIKILSDLSKSPNKSVLTDPENASNVEQSIKKYGIALQNIILYHAYLNMNIDTSSIAGKDVSPFADLKTITNINNQLNGLLTSVEKDKIIRLTSPENIYDPERSSGFSGDKKPGDFINNGSLSPEFTYKVFEINAKAIDDLPQGDKEAILEFHIPADGNNEEKTYSLVISGDGGHISAGEKNYTIDKLMDLRYLFFREKTDDESKFVYDKDKNNTIPQEIKDNIILTREKNGDINVYVKPEGKTIDVSISEDSSGAAKAAITMGILDHSYAPTHVVEENNDYGDSGNGNFTKVSSLVVTNNDTEFTDNFKVFNSGTRWSYYDNDTYTDTDDSKTYSNVKVLKFYMDAKKSFNKTFKWNNESDADAFQSENSSKFSISTAGGTTVSPKRVQVKDGKLTGGVSKPIIVKTEEVFLKIATDSEKRKFIKVTIIMDSNDTYLSMDLDAKTKKEKGIFSILPADGMFYEDELVTNYSPWKDPANGNTQSIPVEEYKDTTQALETVIGKVYSNWNGMEPKWSPDYMPPYVDGIDGKKEFPKFDIKYHTYKEADSKTGGVSLKQSEFIKGKWTGKQIVDNANLINNKYIVWLKTHLNLDPSKEWDENNRFTPETSASGGFFVKRIMNGVDPVVSKKAMDEMEAGFRKYKGTQLTSDEEKYLGIDKVEVEISNADGSPIDEDEKAKNVDAKLSLYRYIESRIASIMEDAINAMFDNFKSKTGTVISESLANFLKHEGDYNGVNLEALRGEEYNVLGKEMRFITTNGNTMKKVNNGAELIKSLTLFIKEFNLQDKYLISSDKELFNQLIDSGDFWNESSYSDIQNPQRITNMVSLLDKISQKISDETGGLTLNDIIQDKLNLNRHDDPNWTENAIINVLTTMVEKISSSSLKLKYTFLSRDFESTYIENLAIGYNLQQIYRRYLEENKDKLDVDEKSIVNKVINGSAFDTNLIVKVAINNGYYNVPFFIEGLSSAKHIVSVATDLLDANLAESAELKLPEYNFLVKTISDPNKLSSMGIMVAGIFMSLIGAIILFISFKNKSSNQKVVIISRIAFVGIIVIGVGLILSPILFSSLFTGTLAVLSA